MRWGEGGSGALEDLDGVAVVDPFEEEFGGVEAVEGEADAAVGGGEAGDGGVAVDEDVAVDLNAVGHGGVLVSGGVVHAGAEGAGGEVAGGGAVVAAGADVGLEDEAAALPGAELLFSEVDFDAFGAGEEGAFVKAAADAGLAGGVEGGEGGAGELEAVGGEEFAAVVELFEGAWGDGGLVELDALAGGVAADGEVEGVGDFLEGDVAGGGVGGEGDGFEGGAGGGGGGAAEGEREQASQGEEVVLHGGGRRGVRSAGTL